MIKEANEINVDVELSTGRKVLVFYANWCGNCNMYKPVLEEYSAKSGVDVIRANIDTEKELVKQFEVQSIPATFIFENGRRVKNFLGYKPLSELETLNPVEACDICNLAIECYCKQC
ncbi:co-chaperone YbbN [Mycoplasma sp. Ms02]|uniref:thioredoxin family protein n=1 Tax=Mycoplasma sp. Ms02 TaxID=353851 RepID=UPI001C896420|nr:thioredoxin family protein [Mycoplasma sp. Ms02]QZE12061.1 thioredoxin family protein [Mycoplasma sp. Ms02]